MIRRLVAWLRAALSPTVPPLLPPRRDTPPPATVVVFARRYTGPCPFCGAPIADGERHECRADSWLD